MVIGNNSLINPYKEGAVINLATTGQLRISGRLSNGELLVSADLPPNGIKLVDNDLQSKPVGWDRNFDDHAFEVVNEKRFPVFQIVYQNEHTAVINGLFDSGNGQTYLVTEAGMIINPSQSNLEENPIHRLFKYPSYRFQGVREEK